MESYAAQPRLPLGKTGLIMAILVSLTTLSLNAEQVTLRAIKDNTLVENTAGSLSNGSGQYLFAGRTNQASGSLRRTLLAFDLSAIPAGSLVTSATLTMNLNKAAAGGPVTLDLHRVSSSWGEGGSNANAQEGGGAAAASGDATWLHRFYNTTTWQTPGGDFSATSSSSSSVGGPGKYTWPSTSRLVSDVQGWIDGPSTNFGWVLMGAEAQPGTARRFDSREATDDSKRPTLTVVYSPAVSEEKLDEFYFPLFGDGGGLSTSVVLLNTGGPVTAHIDIFGRDGNPIPVSFGSLGTSASFEIPLTRGQAFSASSSGSGGGGGTLLVGYISVTVTGPASSQPQAAEDSPKPVGGTAIFTSRDGTGKTLSEAGVPAAEDLTDFTFFLDSIGQKDTGLAVVYPDEDDDSQPVSTVLTLTAWDKGFANKLGTVQRTIGIGEAFGQFVYEIFRDEGAPNSLVQQLRETEAVITVESSEKIAALALRLNGTSLTTFPVIPGRADAASTQ